MKITGKAAEAALGKAHITVNKNAIPNDPEKPFVTSGIRIGSAAMTTRGFNEPTRAYWQTWLPTFWPTLMTKPTSPKSADKLPSFAASIPFTVRKLF